METYSLLREFADSWMLLFLFVFFIGLVLWVLTGKSKSYRDTAEMIFRNDDKPLSDEGSDR